MSVDEYFNRIKEDREKEFLDVGRDLFQQLVVEQTCEVLSENIFRNYFLPKFLGHDNNDKWVLEWIGIAGSPTKPVDIIDTSGTFLFRVPPFLHTKSIFLDAEHADLASIVREAMARSRNLPVLGQRYLESGLQAKENQLRDRIENQDSVNQWTMILDYYNIRGDEQTTQTEGETQSLDDFISY